MKARFYNAHVSYVRFEICFPLMLKYAKCISALRPYRIVINLHSFFIARVINVLTIAQRKIERKSSNRRIKLSKPAFDIYRNVSQSLPMFEYFSIIFDNTRIREV